MTDKLFLKALKRETTSRTPIWFMRQAGRYLPEYRALRATKNGFLDMAYDPVSACEVTMQPIRRFHMDAAILFSDILVVPHALGQKLEFLEGEGPKLDPLRSASDLSRLSMNNFRTVLSPVHEAVARIRNALREEGFDDVALIGFAGSPWTLACYMIEGGGSRDFLKAKHFAYSDPVGFTALMDILVSATASYLIDQIEAGAEALQLFDSWASALDANEFEKWVIEPTAKIISLIKAKHPDIPIIGFAKSVGYNIIPYIQKTGIDAAGLDSSVSTQWAAKTLQPHLTLQGNLDPVCLFAGGNALVRTTTKIMDDLAGGPFVFNLGHGIHKDTPIAHVELAIKTIRSYAHG